MIQTNRARTYEAQRCNSRSCQRTAQEHNNLLIEHQKLIERFLKSENNTTLWRSLFIFVLIMFFGLVVIIEII